MGENYGDETERYARGEAATTFVSRLAVELRAAAEPGDEKKQERLIAHLLRERAFFERFGALDLAQAALRKQGKVN